MYSEKTISSHDLILVILGHLMPFSYWRIIICACRAQWQILLCKSRYTHLAQNQVKLALEDKNLATICKISKLVINQTKKELTFLLELNCNNSFKSRITPVCWPFANFLLWVYITSTLSWSLSLSSFRICPYRRSTLFRFFWFIAFNNKNYRCLKRRKRGSCWSPSGGMYHMLLAADDLRPVGERGS